MPAPPAARSRWRSRADRLPTGCGDASAQACCTACRRARDHGAHRLADGGAEDRAARHAEPPLLARGFANRESFGASLPWSPECDPAAACPGRHRRPAALSGRSTHDCFATSFPSRHRAAVASLLSAAVHRRDLAGRAGAVRPALEARLTARRGARRRRGRRTGRRRWSGSPAAWSPIKIDQTRAFDTEWNAARRRPASWSTPSAA